MRPNRLVSVLAAVSILIYFFYLAGDGVGAYFSPDDLMNLYIAWLRSGGEILTANVLFFSDFFRPMGAVFYRILYAMAGWDPLPFRIACYCLLGFNLFLTYLLGSRLTGSREVAVLGVLISTYHARFSDLYYSTGTVYDLLCFSFYYGALFYYIRGPQTARRIAICSALYIAALNSKEMAVTLPVIFGAYELLYRRPDSVRSFLLAMRTAAITALITAVYVAGKTGGPDRMTSNPAYNPSISPRNYTEGFANYAGKLFYSEEWFTPAVGMALLGLMIAVALISRSRHLQLSSVIIAVGILPVAFILPRGGFVLYIPMVGWALYGATLLVWARDLVLKVLQALRTAAAPARVDQAALFVLAALTLAWVHRPHYDPKWLGGDNHVKASLAGMDQVRPGSISRKARILFLTDPFDADETWQLRGVVQLYFGEKDLEVDSMKRMQNPPSGAEIEKYDYIFDYRDGAVVRVKPAP